MAALLVIGVIGMWLTIGAGGRSEGLALHQGPFWLTAGTVIFAFLSWNGAARSLWIRHS